jgi:hypothetical protein
LKLPNGSTVQSEDFVVLKDGTVSQVLEIWGPKKYSSLESVLLKLSIFTELSLVPGFEIWSQAKIIRTQLLDPSHISRKIFGWKVNQQTYYFDLFYKI